MNTTTMLTTMKNVKKSYTNIDEAYTSLFPYLKRVAESHLLKRDDAFDVVHAAFEKALVNGKNISTFIMKAEIIRMCRRYNKTASYEIPYDFGNKSFGDSDVYE